MGGLACNEGPTAGNRDVDDVVIWYAPQPLDHPGAPGLVGFRVSGCIQKHGGKK